MPNRQIVAYALGEVYPPNFGKNMSALQTAGWTTIIVGLYGTNLSGSTATYDLHDGTNMITARSGLR